MGKNKNHSSKQNKSYTDNLNIQDQQKAYEKQVEEKRNISKKQEDGAPPKKDDDVNRQSPTQTEEYRPSGYDYTKDIRTQDAQTTYEKHVDEQRGIETPKYHKEESYPKDYKSGESSFPAQEYKKEEYDTHSSYTKPKEYKPSGYDYTKDVHTQDAQTAYERHVDEQRGIETPKYHKEENYSQYDRNPSTTKEYSSDPYEKGNDKYPSYTKSEEHKPSGYDYTRNSRTQDEQMAYEKHVDEQRGIKTPSNYEKDKYPSEPSGKVDSTKYNERSSTEYRNAYKIEPDLPKSVKYDYTKNSNIQDAQKNYNNAVDQQRNIPGSYKATKSQESGSNLNQRNEFPSPKNDNSVTPRPGTNQKYDYTKNVAIQNAQQDYNRSVDKQRGILKNGAETPTYQPRYVSPINERRTPTGDILNSPVDLKDLYANSARGGQRNSPFVNQFGLSQEDIKNLLETRDITYSRGIKYKASNQIASNVSTIGHYLYNVSSSGTDMGQGVRQIGEIFSPVAFVVTDAIMMSTHKAMQMGMADRLNRIAAVNRVFGDSIEFTFDTGFRRKTETFAIDQFISNPELGLSKRDILELKEELLRKLRPTGLKQLDFNNPYVARHQLSKFLKKNAGKLTQSEIGAIKMLMELTNADVIGKSIPRRRSRFWSNMRMKLFRYAQQDNAGAGFVFIYTFYKRGYQTLLYGQRALRGVKNAVKMVGKLTLLAGKKAAVAVARTKPVKTLLNTERGRKATESFRSAQSKHNTRKDLKNQKKNLRNERRKAFRDRMRDPFGLRRGRDRLLAKLKNTKVGRAVNKVLSPYRLLRRLLGKLITGVMTIISVIISILMIVLGLCVVVSIVAVLLTSIFISIVSMFDLSMSKEEVIRKNLAYVQELSEKQNDELESMNKRYNTMTVTYQDVKNQDAYNDEKHQTTRPVIETTNSAEILSMAQVYYNFNIQKAPKKELKNYIRKLYNGSHLMTVTTSEYTYIDNAGIERKVVNANVVIRTYYFDDLFNCKLMDGNGIGVIAGTEITDQVWNYLRTAGIPPIQVAGIMGNMYAESGFDPGAVEHGNGIGLGLCQWSFGRRTALENFAASQGKPPSDLKVQLDYFMQEYNPSYFNSYHTGMDNYSMFVNAKTVNDATYYFMWGWERPAAWAGEASLNKRQTAAQTYYDNYIDKELITDSEESEE